VNVTHDDGWKQTEERKISPFLIGLIVVAVLALIFIVQNSNDAPVTVLFWDFTMNIWVVIVIALVLGMALDRLLQMWMRRRKGRRDD
jgi:uncharacterized integral membrane protein